MKLVISYLSNAEISNLFDIHAQRGEVSTNLLSLRERARVRGGLNDQFLLHPPTVCGGVFNLTKNPKGGTKCLSPNKI
jgi:hypothetical protein